MIRDSGPRQNIGFGVPPMTVEEEQPGSSGGGVVSQKLDGHPILKYLSTAAASIIAMGVAGSVVRKGGMRAVFEIQQQALKNSSNGGAVDNAVKSFRKVERYMDELQGVTRAFGNDESGRDLLVERLADGKLARTGSAVRTDGAMFRIDNPDRGEWAMRDEIQQRMVTQARRLPYELPGFYAADKLIIDPILGNQERETNWNNPVDVIGDFASTSIKNIAFNVLPFEVGGAAAKQGYRNIATRIAQDPGPVLGVRNMDMLLEQVGASAVDILNSTLRFSHQSMGSFSSIIQDAATHSKPIKQWQKQASSQPALARRTQHGNANFAHRIHDTYKDLVKGGELRESALDSLPGPFKGMGSAIKALQGPQGHWKRHGQTFDDFQDVISGRKPIQAFRGDEKRMGDLMTYMQKGGGTHIEKYARDANVLFGTSTPTTGKGGSPNLFNTDFYRNRRSNIYNETLVENLTQKSGLTHAQATMFVRKHDKITPFSSKKGPDALTYGEGILDRFQFGSQPYLGQKNEWWTDLVGRAKAQGIPLENSTTAQQLFRGAVKSTDLQFSQANFTRNMNRRITDEWGQWTSDIIPKQASSGLKGMARPFEGFQGASLEKNKNWMIKRTAERMNIPTVDGTGTRRGLADLDREIKSRGLNSSDSRQLRGYLLQNKDISKPWTRNGRNLFGFKPMSVGQASQQGMFSANNPEERQYIDKFIETKAGKGANAGSAEAFRLKAGGIFSHSDGAVVDLGRIGRGVRSFYDAIASETAIPILNFNPLQIIGSNVRASQRRASSIKMISGMSDQPFVSPGGKSNPADYYIWMKQNEFRNKGNVFRMGGDGPRELPGTYNAWSTNSNSMLGRYGRLFTGDTGVQSTANIEGNDWRSRAKRFLDVSPDQESSVMFGKKSLQNRWRAARKDNVSDANPHILASRLAKGGMPAEFGAAQAEGMEGLISTLRNFGYSDNLLKDISQDPRFGHIFAPLGKRNLSDISDTELVDVAKNLVDGDSPLFRGSTGVAPRGVQQRLRNMLRQGEQQDDYWSMATSGQAKSVGVFRRDEQLRNEISNYLIATSGLRNADGAGAPNMDDTIGALYSKIQDMVGRGVISSGQAKEARAATLGLQIDQMRNKAYSEIRRTTKDVPLLELNRATAEAMTSGGNPNVLAALGEFGSHIPGSGEGIRSYLSQVFKKKIQTVPYRDTNTANPIGSDFLLMPNFGTVAQRSGPYKAAKGLIGSSWHDKDSVSTLSAPATHAAVRLNRYFETFGMGLDPSRYRGPADYYARGLIGRRIAPAYIAGATVLSLDRTAGGLVNKDENGDPIYAPLVMGYGADAIAAAQVGLTGLTPGGQTAEEKREELESGSVPIRQGRYWLMGNTPFKGGRIQYYRPSWYQRFKSGAPFAPEMNETPMERLAFGYDFSPLKPLDPYRRERQDAQSRPYPVSGDYFTGPWGALNPVLNSTVGRVLKPRRYNNEEAVSTMLSQYAPVGQGGAYYAGGDEGALSISGQGAARGLSAINQEYMSAAGSQQSSMQPFYGSMGYSAPRGVASQDVRNRAATIAATYSNAAGNPNAHVTINDILLPYGVPTPSGRMPQRVTPGGEVMTGNPAWREASFRLQETLGIYGFGIGTGRSMLGLGSQDLAPDRSVLEPSHRGYSASRAFWNLNIGGLGDLPMPLEGKFSNFEVSEIARRFVPKDPQGISYINNMPNLMGQQYSWLPGEDYPLASVKTGDPFNSMSDADIRLPTTGYARTHQLFPDKYGEIGLANIHDILGNVAPWSERYNQVDKMVDKASMSPMARAKVSQTRAQIESMRIKNEFTPYEYKYSSAVEMAKNPAEYALGRGWEWLSHRDTFINDKFLPNRTAIEDWERDSVYGPTFPTWSSPIEGYVSPFLHKSSQRNPIASALAGATFGGLFGRTPRAKAAGAIIGAVAGSSASVYGAGYEAVTGKRWMPADRRKEIALEENFDILNYTKSIVNAGRARAMGDTVAATQFMQESKKTMFGVDLNATPEQVAQALPSRKREHFLAMLYAPESEREQVLSTAGRLERRLYQAAWGMKVEARPNIPEYFEDHELPGPTSEFWNPLTDTDNVKIKVGQHLGLDMAQMGYYPQQIKEANMINPSYPSMFQASSASSVTAKLRELMRFGGVDGTVSMYPNMLGSDQIQLSAGVF